MALHRAAYLLHADSPLGRHRGDLLLIGSHRPYLDYAADVLPALGEHRVQTAPIADLARAGFAGGELTPGLGDLSDEPEAQVARLKS